jgi:phosphonate transport system substrate-binding protein
MNRRRALVVGGVALFAVSRAWPVDAAAPLEFGIFPYLSPRALLTAHQPLRLFMEERLGHPLQLSTANSYESFNQRTLRGDYDLLITPPHFARLAQVEAKYVPLAVYSKVLRGVIVVRKASPVTEVRQLRGKVVAVPDRLAIVTLVGTRFLAGSGLRANIDYSLLTSTSHASAAFAVAQGEAQAAITELATFQKQIPAEVREALRILTLVGSLPHVMFLAHPRLGTQRIEVLRAGLVDFARSMPGKSFIEASGFEGIRPITDADMKAMDPYVVDLHSLTK